MPNPTYMSVITLPVDINGTIINVDFTIKDAEARAAIASLGNAVYWIGVTTTALSEGATTNPITVDGESVTATKGGLASYDGMEYAWNGSAWQGMGPSNLGLLALANTASGSYTPAGTVQITPGKDSTDNVTGVTDVGTLPYFTQSGETVTFHAGTLPTADTQKTFLTARGSDTAAFTGTQATIQVSPDPVPGPVEFAINVGSDDDYLSFEPPMEEGGDPTSSTVHMSVTYDPSSVDSAKKGVTWSIESSNVSSDWNVTIDTNGNLTATWAGSHYDHYDGDTVVVRATSTYDSRIYAEKTITVTSA